MKPITSVQTNQKFTPSKILMVYTNDPNTYYLEMSEVSEEKGMLRLHGAVPLSKKAAAALFKLTRYEDNQTINFESLMPPGLLYSTDKPGMTKLIWWEPARMRRMIFAKHLKMPVTDICLPGLVWMIYNEKLYVYACKGSVKGLNDKLYHAPFLNMFHTGDVCMGNAKFSKDVKGDAREIIERYSSAFWNSEFTEHLNNSSPIKGNLITQYKKHGDKPFDEKLLIDSSLTVKSLINLIR